MRPKSICVAACALLALAAIIAFIAGSIRAEKEREERRRDAEFNATLESIRQHAKKIEEEFDREMQRIDREHERNTRKIASIANLNSAKAELAKQLELSARYEADPNLAEEKMERVRKLREEIKQSYNQ